MPKRKGWPTVSASTYANTCKHFIKEVAELRAERDQLRTRVAGLELAGLESCKKCAAHVEYIELLENDCPGTLAEDLRLAERRIKELEGDNTEEISILTQQLIEAQDKYAALEKFHNGVFHELVMLESGNKPCACPAGHVCDTRPEVQ